MTRTGFSPIASLAVAVAVLFVALSPADAGGADAPKLRHWQRSTDDLRLIYYSTEHSYIVPHLARCFHNALSYHKKLFDYEPSGPVSVVLQDFDDHGYAGTATIPRNYITIGIEPFEYVYDTCPTNERMNWVMNHEMVHVVACDESSPADRFFRTIFFGKVPPTSEDPISMFYSYLTSPRYYAPRWYHEGIAVFMETWMAGGIGRAQNGYDEMVFRTMVRDDADFYDIVGLESEGTTKDFQTGHNSYLYGTRFASYVAYRYGPEKMLEWFKRSDGSKRYFSSQFKHVYGVPLDVEWREWVRWEHEWQTTNLDSIRKYPVTPYRPLSDRALGSVSRMFLDRTSRKLYAGVQYPAEFAHIAEIDIDSGEMRKVCEIPGAATYFVTSLAMDDSTGTLFFTANNASGWRSLHCVDIATGKERRLCSNTRTGDIVFNRKDGSLWGVQHHNGLSRLVRFPPPYSGWAELLILPYGRDMFDLDISPDGRYLTASTVEISGAQRLIRMDLDALITGDSSFEVLHEFPGSGPANFTYSPDGRYMYGTSYYTGISNVFRYDFETSTMDAITNAETGFFRPMVASEGSLIALAYTGSGFLPVEMPDEPIYDVSPVRYLGSEIAATHAVVRDWMIGSPASVDIDSLTVYSGTYSGLLNIRPASAYPIVEGYKDYPAYGVRIGLSDPAWVHSLDITASYTPNETLHEDERPHLRFRYSHYQWTLEGSYNRADFYDLFGPTKSSRQGYSLGGSYWNYLFLEDPRALQYSLGVTGFRSYTRLADAQNVATEHEDFISAYAQLQYHDFASTIGAIEAEKGVLCTVAARDFYVQREHYPRANVNLTLGFLTPIDHSSVWLRASAGHAFGERSNSFSNFYFGGFGNNWIDNGDVNRYRQYYSFPGTELNAIGGQNYAKGMIEWTLPPVRFRQLGIPGLYANWARLSLFSTGIITNVDSEEYRRSVVDVGVQLNLKLVMFSLLESTFSVGYAIAAHDGWETNDEFMISLKILR